LAKVTHVAYVSGTALSSIFANDYIQYNPAGQPKTEAKIFELLRTGSIRNPSIVSTGRTIRIFGDTAVVHGSEDDEVVFGGKWSRVRHLYLDVLQKRNGEWKIVASQLASPPTNIRVP
jgi:hypothetical protein